MEYEDFELQLGPRSGEGYLARVLRSPAGQGEAIIQLSGEPQPGVERDLRARAASRPASPETTGSRLFQSLFSGQIGILFHQSLSACGTDRGLRIRVRINPRDPGSGPLHGIPWEILYREDTDDFLALSRRTPIVRALDIPRPDATLALDPPLRILVVLSQDPLSAKLDLGAELDRLRAALAGRAGIVLEVLENPGANHLREALGTGRFHVLHYMGHGTFDPDSGEGALLLRSQRGGREVLGGRHLATKIKDSGSLRLVVLNACETALASGGPGHNPFAGVATALLLGGVPAVVAMQSTIGDHHAIAFSASFYEHLARGLPVDEALTEGRQAIHSLDPGGGSWAIPVLFLRTPTGNLFTLVRKPPRRRFRPAFALSAGAALLLALVALPAIPPALDRLNEPLEDLATPTPAPAESPAPPAPEHREPEPVRSEPVRARSLTLGKEGSLRVEIVGHQANSGAFERALRNAVERQSAAGFAGWTVHLQVGAPRIEGYEEAGMSLQSCQLSAVGQLRGHGKSFDLGSLEDSGAKFKASLACDEAAAGIAESAVHRIVPYIRKEG